MEPVKAVYVRQGEDGTVLLGDFQSMLEDIHAGEEVEVTIAKCEHPDVTAEANGNGTTAEDSEDTGTEPEAQ